MEVSTSIHPYIWVRSYECVSPPMLTTRPLLTLHSYRTTAMLTPGLEPLTEQLQSNDAEVSTWLLTAPTFWTSAAAFIVVAGTDVWGRRPFYIWSVVMLALSNFAGYFSQNFAMLAIARTANGLFSAPLFTLVTATVSDVFFVHQRGKSISVWNVMLNSGAQIG
jgi:MFS family permease